MITRRGLLKVLGGGAAGLLALGGYAFAYEPLARLRIARYALTPPGWTPGLKLRIVALADLHACEPWMPASRIASICARANALEGDMTVLLGDYAAGMRTVTRYRAFERMVEGARQLVGAARGSRDHGQS